MNDTSYLLSYLFHMPQMIKVSSIILDNWVPIYFLAVTIKTKETSEKYLCKVACTVISLMNERSVANVDSSINFDQAIATMHSRKKSTTTNLTWLHQHSTSCCFGTEPSVNMHSMKAGVSSFKKIHSLDHLDKVHASWLNELLSSISKHWS